LKIPEDFAIMVFYDDEEINLKKRLVVCDVDETLVEWQYSLEGNSCFERTGATELLEFITNELDADIVLFSTANVNYVRKVRREIFSDINIVGCYGTESTTFYQGDIVKDISIFTDKYDIENIVLVDDKKRNARLYPKNFVRVAPPMRNEGFDSELLRVQRRLQKFFDRQEKRLSEESL